MSLLGMVKSDGGIQPVLAVLLPSAQTFINITSQPYEKPTSNLERKRESAGQIRSLRLTTCTESYEHYCIYMEGLLAPAWNGRVGLGVVVSSCVHVNIHLHLIVQDLH